MNRSLDCAPMTILRLIGVAYEEIVTAGTPKQLVLLGVVQHPRRQADLGYLRFGDNLALLPVMDAVNLGFSAQGYRYSHV